MRIFRWYGITKFHPVEYLPPYKTIYLRQFKTKWAIPVLRKRKDINRWITDIYISNYLWMKNNSKLVKGLIVDTENAEAA